MAKIRASSDELGDAMIAEQKKAVDEITTEYLTFRNENEKEIRAIQRIKNQTTENEVTMVRESSSSKKFYPNHSIRPKYLNPSQLQLNDTSMR